MQAEMFRHRLQRKFIDKNGKAMDFLRFVLITPLILIIGCKESRNLAALCDNHVEICNEFEADSWCRRERVEVGFNNLSLKEQPTELKKYHLLIAYENYAACMNHAAKIEHIKMKEKKTKRVNNYIKAKQKIEVLSEETKTSEHPELLYYHWTRYLNNEALNKFLAMEGTDLLENSLSLYNLATYYTKRDPNKTIRLLYRSLELYNPKDELNIEIFKTLATIFEYKKEVKQAYIWLRVLELYRPDDKLINNDAIHRFKLEYKLDFDFLDKVADATYDKINDGVFVAPRR